MRDDAEGFSGLMLLGYGLLIVALVATVAANVLFTLSRRGGKLPFGKWARIAVGVGAAGIVGASAWLMALIGGHRFEFHYVAEYSSRASATRYLIAAFWGGQEGSILLWAFWTAVLGVVLAKRSGDKAAWVWPVYGLVQTYLLGLLLLKCPFRLGDGPLPPDGKGLNPLLQNPWMVIHPPILFLGFASTAVPAAWTVHALLHKDWDGWVKSAFPWTLFSFATLGFGLSLGGYWAYETLGWGGFWAWDPVENTSLVPWLFLTALLHGFSLQRRNGGARIANLLLGTLPFATMNYGTFLTRTGILSDFSVHSFSSLGTDGYWVMLGAIIVFTAGPLALLVMRGKQIPRAKSIEQPVSRESGFVAASALLALLGIGVTLGMSAPLLTKLWMPKGAALEADYYNQIGYPLAIVMGMMMAFTPYLAWKTGNASDALKRLWPPYIGAIVVTIGMTAAAWKLGVRKPWMVLLFATSLFTTFANLALVIPRLKSKGGRLSIGGFTAHAGAGMVLAGVAILVAFSTQSEAIPLVKGEPKKVGGTTLTYLGNTSHPFEKDNSLRIRVGEGNGAWEANPRYYYANWEGKDTLFANPPAIRRHLFGDDYLALGGEQEELLDDPDRSTTPNNQFSMKMGETKSFGDYSFTLETVSMDDKAAELMRKHDEKGFNALPEVLLTAVVTVRYKDQEKVATPVVRNVQKSGIFSKVAAIPGPEGEQVILRFVPPPTERQVAEVEGMWQQAVEAAKQKGQPGTTEFQQALMPSVGLMQKAEQMRALSTFQTLRFETYNAPDDQDVIFVDLSTKPFIWLVWLGTLLYSAGGLVAYRRRAAEAGEPDKAVA